MDSSSSSFSWTTICSSYETVKYVAIPDARLGILRWILWVGILSYVIVVELIQHGGYLQSYPVTGVVRFSLQQPTQDNCNPAAANCPNAFAPLTSLPYCAQHHQHQHQHQYSNTTTNSTTITPTPLKIAAEGKSKDESSSYVMEEEEDHYYAGPIYPCQIYEAVNAQLIRETSLVIWTRAITYNQTLICHEGSEMSTSTTTTCPQTYQNEPNHDNNDNNNNDSTPFYIAQAEAFTILLEHAVTSSTICQGHAATMTTTTTTGSSSSSSSRTRHKHKQHDYACSAQAKRYQGRLKSISTDLCRSEYAKNNSFVSSRSNRLRDVAPCYIGPNRTTITTSTSTSSSSSTIRTSTSGGSDGDGQDFFSLNVLLQAAGATSLDGCIADDDSSSHRAGNDSSSSCSNTLRSAGATLLLDVVWNDVVSWRGRVEPYYTYIPQLIGDSYKESQAFYYEPYRTARILMRAHGIKVAVMLHGTFHSFQMLQFLVTLTTALGLLAVARVVVDNLMLYVLPDKERYQQAKYETVLVDADADADAGNENNNDDDRTLPLSNTLSQVHPGDGLDALSTERNTRGGLREPLLPSSSSGTDLLEDGAS